MPKKKQEKKSKSILLPFEERHTLGLRTPRKKIECPECGNEAERDRNGDWRCIAAFTIQMPYGSFSQLTCGARGVTLNDDLAVTSGPIKQPHRNETYADKTL